MLNKIAIYSLILVSLFTCQRQDAFPIPVESEENKSKNEIIGRKLAVASYNKSYLDDFTVFPSGEKPPIKEYFRLIKDAKLNNLSELSSTYPNAKADLLELSANNEIGAGKNDIIQIVSLPYMRNLLIPAGTENSKEEIKDLLELIIPTSPNDLDVLVDAYIEVRDILSEEEQTKIFDYIVLLYEEQSRVVEPSFREAKLAYDNAESLSDKYGAIIQGKRFERMSKSLDHADKKLNLRSMAKLK